MLEESRKYLRIYWLYFKQFWKTRLIYKADFLTGFAAHSLSVVFSLLFLTLLFTQVDQIQGWTFNQMLFLAGVGGFIMNLHHIFLFNIYRLGDDYVVTGDFDRFLLRPLSPLFQVYADEVRDNSVAKLLVNIGILAYAVPRLDLQLFTIEKMLYSAGAVASGVLVFAAVYLAFASTSFWTGRSRAAIWLIFRMSDFRKYPYGIYGAAVQVILVTLVPIAFASFFPASFLLEKQGWTTFQLGALAAGPVFYILAYRFWRLGLSNYSSTGS
ncbi:MAG: ABC transporter permease [Candidatus Nanohaloarchaea archaeon]